LHLAVYDQQDDFGVLHKATTSKLKHFTKALGNPSLYNAPSPLGALEKFGNNLKAFGLDHVFLVQFPFPFKNNKSGSLFFILQN
jgi:hypothetical protein